MPTVDDYQAFAPFNLEELVTAANAILRDRPNVKVQIRTVRYYISEGFLPSPSGGPKFARYGMDHLRRLVQIRTWLDEGVSLGEAASRLGITRTPSDKTRHAPAVLELSSPMVLRSAAQPPMQPDGDLVRRIQLTPNAVLEIRETRHLEGELNHALVALQRLLRH